MCVRQFYSNTKREAWQILVIYQYDGQWLTNASAPMIAAITSDYYDAPLGDLTSIATTRQPIIARIQCRASIYLPHVNYLKSLSKIAIFIPLKIYAVIPEEQRISKSPSLIVLYSWHYLSQSSEINWHENHPSNFTLAISSSRDSRRDAKTVKRGTQLLL